LAPRVGLEPGGLKPINIGSRWIVGRNIPPKVPPAARGDPAGRVVVARRSRTRRFYRKRWLACGRQRAVHRQLSSSILRAHARGVGGAREGRIQCRASPRTGWTTGASSTDAFGMSFSCPVCSCPTYSSVVVPRPKGGSYTTSFFACGDCTTMFLDPAKYTRTRKPKVVRIAPDLRTAWPATRRAGRPTGAQIVAGLGVAPRQKRRVRSS